MSSPNADDHAAPDARTLREARAQYFVENDFGADGGYASPWVDFKLGKLPLPFPNTGSRVRAVRYHDLHHILTGYRTDLPGEAEISAWELGGGCKNFAAAWLLNLSGLAFGGVVAPRRTLRAFLRGRASRTLYGEDLETTLDRRVDEVRNERMGVAAPPDAVGTGLFGLAFVAGATVGVGSFAVLAAMGPALFVWGLVAPRWMARVVAAG